MRWCFAVAIVESMEADLGRIDAISGGFSE
jgi:hypothetical protein